MTDDPLAGLRAWHPPDPVSWWPLAPGWWVLGALVCVLLVLIGLGWWRRWHRGRAARTALRQLAALEATLAADGDRRRFVAGVSRLLRRLALVRFPRERVARLTGRAWLEFLDATGGGGGFVRGAGRVLAEGGYRAELVPGGAWDPERLSRLARTWIRANAREGRRLASHNARAVDHGKTRPSSRKAAGKVARPRRGFTGHASGGPRSWIRPGRRLTP